jgi:flagellar biosynthesis chaperone FliJ
MARDKATRFLANNLAREAQDKQAGLIDDLAEFEQYRKEVLEGIRADRKAGMTAEQILEKYQGEVKLRQLTIALTGQDKDSLAASKDLRDRAEGRAVERQEHTHRLENLPEEQLDSLIQSELEAAKAGDTDRLN